MHHHHIDRYAQAHSPVHALDARTKIVATATYLFVLISFDRYTVSALAPMAIWPVGLLLVSGVPVLFALRRVVILSPFIIFLAAVCPFYDRVGHAVAFGPWRFVVTGGWLTAANVTGKFALGVMALMAVMCTTAFATLLEALRWFRVPKLLVMQLGFLYRYLFVLTGEAMRLRRARDFRGAHLAPLRRRLAAVGGLVGSLLVRTLDRSDRIHLAMQARGYRGEPHALRRLRFRPADGLFLLVAAAYLTLCRCLLANLM